MVQADLVKDGGHQYFIKYLEGAEPGISADSRAQAAFVLAVICDGYPRGRMLCAEQGLLPKLLSLLATMVRPLGSCDAMSCTDVSHHQMCFFCHLSRPPKLLLKLPL